MRLNVDFGVKADSEDDNDYGIISVDVIPAFEMTRRYTFLVC